jgi:hypothetical protein
MTTEEFFKYAVEMCQKCSSNGCEKCEALPGGSSCWHSTNPDFSQVKQVIQNWVNHNYLTRKKAILSLFLNIPCSKNGCPNINACVIEPCLKDTKCKQYETCSDCDKDFWFSPLN